MIARGIPQSLLDFVFFFFSKILVKKQKVRKIVHVKALALHTANQTPVWSVASLMVPRTLPWALLGMSLKLKIIITNKNLSKLEWSPQNMSLVSHIMASVTCLLIQFHTFQARYPITVFLFYYSQIKIHLGKRVSFTPGNFFYQKTEKELYRFLAMLTAPVHGF